MRIPYIESLMVALVCAVLFSIAMLLHGHLSCMWCGKPLPFGVQCSNPMCKTMEKNIMPEQIEQVPIE